MKIIIIKKGENNFQLLIFSWCFSRMCVQVLMQAEATVTEFLYCPGITGLKIINISILCCVPVLDSKFPWPLELLGHLTQDFMWRLHLSVSVWIRRVNPVSWWSLLTTLLFSQCMELPENTQIRCLSDVTKCLNATAVPNQCPWTITEHPGTGKWPNESQNHQIPESARLAETFQIIQSHHQPNTTITSPKPCPQVPGPDVNILPWNVSWVLSSLSWLSEHMPHAWKHSQCPKILFTSIPNSVWKCFLGL